MIAAYTFNNNQTGEYNMNTETVVLNALGNRQRMRTQTDLNQFFKGILREHSGLDEKEFLAVFRKLQEQGAGALIIGRKNNPNRFIWNYNLKEVAQAAKQGSGMRELIPLPKKSRGRPALIRRPKVAPIRSVRNRRIVAKPSSVQIVLNLDSNIPVKELEALLELAKGLQK